MKVLGATASGEASAVPAYVTAPDAAAFERKAHRSLEAEQSVLGAVLLDNRAMDRVSGVVSESSFWLPAHALIWAAASKLLNAGKAADPVTVFERLEVDGTAEAAGGLEYLNLLVTSVASSANVRVYAQIVAEKAAKRAVQEAADKAVVMAQDEALAAEVLERIAGAFAGISATQMRTAPRVVADLIGAALDRYEALAEGKASPAMATGIFELDRLLNGGLRPGKVYGIAARPSVGKSSAARAILVGLAAGGFPSLLLSQEMPAEEVMDCLMAQIGRVESGRLATGRLDSEDWSRVADAAEAARLMPIYVDDDGGLTISQIRAKARSVKGLRVLVLDYLQLSTSTLKNATTNDQVAEISKGLKQIAMQLGIAVVVLSQLNRAVEQRADREPQLSDLRDSGSIEQDLDAAVMLWTLSEPEDGPRIVGWKVAKHRGGAKGRFAMCFDAAVYAWSSTAWQASPQAGEQMQRGRGASRRGYE